MKKLAFIAALLPGSAFAHGAHAPVADGMHGLAHAVPGAMVLFMAILLVLKVIWRSDNED